MAGKSEIQWTDATWNCVRGCSLVSAGCKNCYAMKQAHRFSGPGKAYEGLTELGPNGPRWNGKVRAVPEMLDWPLKRTKPLRIFVNSMSDLFHEDVPDEFIDRVFAVMRLTKHTYQILTKRPKRMMEYLARPVNDDDFSCEDRWSRTREGFNYLGQEEQHDFPLGNVWLGVSVEDQKTADERIPLLLQTPAAVRFVSYEPALGPVDFESWLSPWVCLSCKTVYRNSGIDLLPRGEGGGPKCLTCSVTGDADALTLTAGIDWIIVGGESGYGARQFNIQWARDIVRQCKAAGVACFVKQLGARPVQGSNGSIETTIPLRDGHGGDWSEWQADLRVRDFPEVANA